VVFVRPVRHFLAQHRKMGRDLFPAHLSVSSFKVLSNSLSYNLRVLKASLSTTVIRFEVFMAVTLHILIVCILTLFSAAGGYQRFRGSVSSPVMGLTSDCLP
jgi:hypothetical protein